MEIKPKYRKAIFAVVYFKKGKKIKYLLLKRKLHWKGWEFPKGGVKKKETLVNAVKREVKEETGLKPIKIKKFYKIGKYNYDKKYPDRKGFSGQTYSLYSTEVKKEKVRIDKKEHSAYKWVKFEKAIKKLTWGSQKKCLDSVNAHLTNK